MMTPDEYEASLDDPDDDPGGCEHGDHPNRDPGGNRRVCPEGRRFCSQACADCEAADFDEATQCCAGLCGFPSAIGGCPAEPAVATERRYCNRCAAEQPHSVARATRTCRVCGNVGSNGPAVPPSHPIGMHLADRLYAHASKRHQGGAEMTPHHAAGPGPWDDVRLAACGAVAARALLDAGLAPGAGSVEDVLSEVGRDDRLRAALEGAFAGARAVFDAVRDATQALNGSQRPADRWVDNGDVLRGAAYVERVVWGALGPVEFPPAGPPDGPPEVCAFTTPEQASRALAYARKAAPAPAAASAAAMAPVIEALSGTPGGDGRVGGWVPRLAAAVFVSFVHRSAPPGGCSFEETSAARGVARALAGALAERDANPAGPPVRVALSGPQARAVWQVIGRARTARPWRVMDALAASWDDMERPRNRPATGGGAAAGRHGGKLTMGAGAAEWLRQALVRTADARRNRSSYLCVAKALGEAIERARAAEGATRPGGCEP